jgi:hypothetical protein
MSDNTESEHNENAASAGDAEAFVPASSEPQPSHAVWVPALKEAALAFGAAAVVLVIAYVFIFRTLHPEFVPFMDRGNVTAQQFPGNQFIPVRFGNGGYQDGAALITEYQDGSAILELRTRFQAEDYPFIKFEIEGLTTWSDAFVFWQVAGDPGNIHRLKLNRSWDEVTQVAMPYGYENYRGEITNLAVGFVSDPTDHDNDGDPLLLKGVELRPYTAFGVAEQIFEDWTNPPLWQGYSNNIVRGIHANGMLFPNAVANLLVITGVALAGLWRFRNRLRGKGPSVRLLAVALCLCLYGWGFNDALRWHWRVAQLMDTHERYAGLPLEERIYNNPIRCGRRDDCFEHLLPYF